jgi:hypothetical protein
LLLRPGAEGAAGGFGFFRRIRPVDLMQHPFGAVARMLPHDLGRFLERPDGLVGIVFQMDRGMERVAGHGPVTALQPGGSVAPVRTPHRRKRPAIQDLAIKDRGSSSRRIIHWQ